jgi:hypothetical protein
VVPYVRVFAALHPLSTDNSQVMTTTSVGCSVIEQVALAQLVIAQHPGIRWQEAGKDTASDGLPVTSDEP